MLDIRTNAYGMFLLFKIQMSAVRAGNLLRNDISLVQKSSMGIQIIEFDHMVIDLWAYEAFLAPF